MVRKSMPGCLLHCLLAFAVSLAGCSWSNNVGNSTTAVGPATSQPAPHGMGTDDNLLVLPNTPSSSSIKLDGSIVRTLTAHDCDAIQMECPAVAHAVPIVLAHGPAVHGDKTWTPLFIYGTTPSFLTVRGWEDLAEGDNFSDREVAGGAKICLIGQTIRKEIFPRESPVGQEIRVGNVSLTIVGVLSRRGANGLAQDQDDIVLVPWTTVKTRFTSSSLPKGNPGADIKAGGTSVDSASGLYPKTVPPLFPAGDKPPLELEGTVDQILVKAIGVKDMGDACRQIKILLHERHRIKPQQPDDFTVCTMADVEKAHTDTKK